MKKIFVVLMFVVIMLMGCDSSDEMMCMQSVEKTFPNADIRPVGRYVFIVKDSNGSIWYVKTMYATTPDVSYKVKVF